jgi:hypothetical protein
MPVPAVPERKSSRSDTLDLSMKQLQDFFPGTTASPSSSGITQRQRERRRLGSVGDFATESPRRGSDESTSSNDSSTSTSSTGSAASYRLRELLSDSCYSKPRRCMDDILDSKNKLNDLVNTMILMNLEMTRDSDDY